MFISENIKIYLLETYFTTIFVEYIQEKRVCLFANSSEVCHVQQSCQC